MRYTDETVELIAEGEYEVDNDGDNPYEHIVYPWADVLTSVKDAYRRRARRGLDLLAAAGLLIPPGAKVAPRWGVRIWLDGGPPTDREVSEAGRDSREEAEEVVAYHARMRAANPTDDSDPQARRWIGNASLISQSVITTEWEEVST